MADLKGSENAADNHTVRFKSTTEDIAPVTSHDNEDISPSATQDATIPREKYEGLTDEEFKKLPHSCRGMQQRRMSSFAFEPCSLPGSRASSPNRGPGTPKRSGSPHAASRKDSALPLTPAATRSHEDDGQKTSNEIIQDQGALKMTPLPSPRMSTPPPTKITDVRPPSIRSSSFEASAHTSRSDSTQPTSRSNDSSAVPVHPHRGSAPFLIGASSDSAPPSPRPDSLSGSGAVTPGYPPDRPYTPMGDGQDPYARHKRPPQVKELSGIESRFIFGRDKRNSGSIGSLHEKEEKRHSTFSLASFGNKKEATAQAHDTSAHGSSVASSLHNSVLDLKRFLKGSHKKRSSSPAPAARSERPTSKVSTRHNSTANLPFSEEHGLESRYGKFGKVLGSGAGGSVRVLKRSSDGVSFAVKEFRAQHSYETDKEYAKKVTAEFCIGSTLHHGNIIETLDIIQERGKWFEVMEFAPYDLFNIVMSGKMTREEVSCAFMQITSGVTYLHQMGLAHRDLKLDNVVVNEHGILKIIDFGSATVFQYPFENDMVMAHGVVGSDPYLAPEVYTEGTYVPPAVDIWSLAIIYCCMTLKRFPWKIPRATDNSFKLFCAPPSPNTPKYLLTRAVSSGELQHPPGDYKDIDGVKVPQSIRPEEEEGSKHHHHHHHHRSDRANKSEPGTHVESEKTGETSPTDDKHNSSHKNSTVTIPDDRQEGDEREVSSPTETKKEESTVPTPVRGPWRLLRLLPRESRYIISRMLQIDPAERATIKEVWNDPWIRSISFCWQEEAGKVHFGEGHTHTLVSATEQ